MPLKKTHFYESSTSYFLYSSVRIKNIPSHNFERILPTTQLAKTSVAPSCSVIGRIYGAKKGGDDVESIKSGSEQAFLTDVTAHRDHARTDIRHELICNIRCN